MHSPTSPPIPKSRQSSGPLPRLRPLLPSVKKYGVPRNCPAAPSTAHPARQHWRRVARLNRYAAQRSLRAFFPGKKGSTTPGLHTSSQVSRRFPHRPGHTDAHTDNILLIRSPYLSFSFFRMDSAPYPERIWLPIFLPELGSPIYPLPALPCPKAQISSLYRPDPLNTLCSQTALPFLRNRCMRIRI